MTRQQIKDRKLLITLLQRGKYPTNSTIIKTSRFQRQRVIKWFARMLGSKKPRPLYCSGSEIAKSLEMKQSNFDEILMSLTHIIFRTGGKRTKTLVGGKRRYWRIRRDVLDEAFGEPTFKEQCEIELKDMFEENEYSKKKEMTNEK